MTKIIQLLLLTLIAFQTELSAKVSFSPVTNYNTQDSEALAVSERLSNDLLNSKCFEVFMVEREQGKHSSRGYKLHTTNGKTALEVVNHLRTTDLTTPVVMYYKNNNVSGYRWTGNPTIYTNSKFHRGANACSRASNLTHEWSHVAGYSHTFKANSLRPFSVPYSINAAFKVCCKCKSMLDCEILKLKEAVKRKFKTVCYRSWKTLWLKNNCYQEEISP
mgnify:CR=1 FL=1